MLTAKTQTALRAQARRLHDHLADHPGLDLTAAARTLATRRATFDHRGVVIAGDRTEALHGLHALAEDRPAPNLREGTVQPGKTAFIYSGQGTQYPDMGQHLYATHPAYAATLDQVAEALQPHLAPPLRAVLTDPAHLRHTANAQPALFAISVALTRTAQHHSIHPHYLTGHSLGELTAAHVAGLWDLADACELITARARLMQKAAEGMMLAVEAEEEAVLPLLTPGVSLAAVNGRASVVISGVRAEVEEVQAQVAALGYRAKPLATDRAFHSPLMDDVLKEFQAVAESVTYRRPVIPIVSALTGEPATVEELTDPAYWVRQLRETVRFADAARALARLGVTRSLEMGPDAVLTPYVAGAVPMLRRNRPDGPTLLAALAHAHVGGTAVDWAPHPALRGGTGIAEVPTYPFEHRRFWPAPAPPPAPAADRTGHPMVDRVIELDDGGVLFLGGLSRATQPWLADHQVLDRVLVPGVTFLELTAWAGRQAGCDLIAELVHESPLVLTADSAVELQLRLGPADDAGERRFTLRCRPARESWLPLATGVLSTGRSPAGTAPDAWPPAAAVPLDLAGFYDEYAAKRYYRWGPVFRGMRAAWREGTEIFAEVRLPDHDHVRPELFTPHPALLDASMHALGAAGDADGLLADRGAATERPRIPFTWTGVALHGAGTREVRVRLAPSGPHGLLMELFDLAGRPVATVESVTLRPVSAERLAPKPPGDLLHVVWRPVDVPGPTAKGPLPLMDDLGSGESLRTRIAAGSGPAVVAAPSPATDVHAATQRVRELLQDWLAAAGPSRLVITTRGAVAVSPGDPVSLSAAAVWGLVRSAQNEYPGRFGLVDLDDASAAVDAEDHDQLALRNGRPYAPALESLPAAEAGSPFTAEGTVLITGGTGALGSVIARHLAKRHGVRRLLLASRRGPAAPGAAALAEDLGALGAEVSIAACDVADGPALAGLLGQIPADRPLTAVVHTAGVLQDAVVTSLDGERLDRVLRPKIDAAVHLDELTQRYPVTAFVLFSSAAGILGTPGQGAYAAANAALDALARRRHRLGLPATSLAWGPWAEAGGMAGRLAEGAKERLRRIGLSPLDRERALGLFDTASVMPDPVVVPAAFEDPRTRRPQAPPGPDQAAGLAGLPVAERRRRLERLVGAEAALVMGGAPGTVDPRRPFQDLGFDSLMAVELRSRLASATGLPLPATLIFDHPTPEALADHLHGLLPDPIDTDPIDTDAAGSDPIDSLDADGLVRLALGDAVPGEHDDGTA
ncbi:type I polyketide synthase [Actinomadura fibrosa]|uniref:SDR family NAD(P)-dependent oxidoreductase n=1 Tax=Actinomadura fibrosa TaxID=111802 RepID=A0ABW2XJ38_9ACTN